jgi:two-component system OmpR family response regulator
MKTSERWPLIPARILCVDDNRDSADSAALLFKMLGFDARACYDGASALALNETFRPGVCFIDLNMPKMDGDEMVRRLQAGHGWQPRLLVAVTAMSDDASRARIATAGFQMHLIKPVDPDKLLDVVDQASREEGRDIATSANMSEPRP